MIEQFATGMHDDLPDFLLPYCRNVTWRVVRVLRVNALVGGVLAVAAPPRVWAFYTGFLSYVLIAVLAVGEYVFHKSRFRFYEDGWIDRLWRRALPARAHRARPPHARNGNWPVRASRTAGSLAMTAAAGYFAAPHERTHRAVELPASGTWSR